MTTNFEKIKAMNIEEMAEFLEYREWTTNKEEIKQWLEAESEEQL